MISECIKKSRSLAHMTFSPEATKYKILCITRWNRKEMAFTMSNQRREVKDTIAVCPPRI
jgi:hypothetical protein